MATQKFFVFKLDGNAVVCLGEIAVDAATLPPNAGKFLAFALRDAIAVKDCSITDVLAVRIFTFDSTTQRKKGHAIDYSAVLATGTAYCYEFNKRKVDDAESTREKKRERLEHQVVDSPPRTAHLPETKTPHDSSFFSEESSPPGRSSEQLLDDLDQQLQSAAVRETETIDATDLINNKVLNETSKTTLVSHIESLVAAAQRGTKDKNNYPLACTVCGSGGGKTTLLWLIANAWRHDVAHALGVTSIRVAFATFNNTCSYTAEEGNVFQKPSARLGVRLLASYRGCSMSYIKQMLMSSCNKRFGQLNITRFLQKLSPASDDTSATVILIDELLSLRGSNQEVSELLYELAVFQQNELIAGRKVLVVVTSLSSTQLSLLPLVSQRALAPISLPMIPARVVVEEAREFVQNLKKIRTREDFSDDTVHHLISEFCATGGHMRSMARTIKHFQNHQNSLQSTSTLFEVRKYPWASTVLRASLFKEWFPTDSIVATGTRTTLQDLIDSHLIAIVDSSTTSEGSLVVRQHVTVSQLLSMPRNDGDLTSEQCLCLQRAMSSLRYPQPDGMYAKRFEDALAQIFSLRLSLLPKTDPTFEEFLPEGQGPAYNNIRNSILVPTDCSVRTVPKLEKALFQKKKRRNGDIVLSNLSNESAVEGYMVLNMNGSLRIVFLQMKFWKYCPPAEISKWEESIRQRAVNDFGLRSDEFYTTFFSTSQTFVVSGSRSCSWPLNAIETLFAPFGIAPMILYAKERRTV